MKRKIKKITKQDIILNQVITYFNEHDIEYKDNTKLNLTYD